MAFMNLGGKKNDNVDNLPPMDFPPQDNPQPQDGFYQPADQPQADMFQQDVGQPQVSDPNLERMRIEEMAEAIIDEKWEEMLKNISKIAEWKDKTDSVITKLEQEMKDLKDNFDRLHKAIIGKISEYDRNILNVGTEIKAMEKVFQKILPTFTENVSELSRITKNLNQKAKLVR